MPTEEGFGARLCLLSLTCLQFDMSPCFLSLLPRLPVLMNYYLYRTMSPNKLFLELPWSWCIVTAPEKWCVCVSVSVCLCVSVSVCVSVCESVCTPLGSEGTGSPGARVTGTAAQCVCGDLNSGPLQEQQVFLTTDSSLADFFLKFYTVFVLWGLEEAYLSFPFKWESGD